MIRVGSRVTLRYDRHGHIGTVVLMRASTSDVQWDEPFLSEHYRADSSTSEHVTRALNAAS